MGTNANCRAFIKVKSTNRFTLFMRINQKILLSLGFMLLLFSSIQVVTAKPKLELLGSQLLDPTALYFPHGEGYQQRILWSNLTQRWYCFYQGLNSTAGNSVLYAVFDSVGNCEAYNQSLIGGTVGYGYSFDIWDYDIDIDMYGEKIYAVWAVDVDFPFLNNAKHMGGRDNIDWGYFAVNPSTKLIDRLSPTWETISNDRQNKQAVNIAITESGHQIVTYSDYLGGAYRGNLYYNNESTTWNTNWWVPVDTLISWTMAWNRIDTKPKPVYVDMIDGGKKLFIGGNNRGGADNNRDTFYMTCDNIEKQNDEAVGGGAELALDFNASRWIGHYTGNDVDLYAMSPWYYYLGLTASSYPAKDSDGMVMTQGGRNFEGYNVLVNNTVNDAYDEEDTGALLNWTHYMGLSIATKDNHYQVYITNNENSMYMVNYTDRFQTPPSDGIYNYSDTAKDEAYIIFNSSRPFKQQATPTGWAGAWENQVAWDYDVGTSIRAYAQNVDTNSSSQTYAMMIIRHDAITGDYLDLYVMNFGEPFTAPPIPEASMLNITLDDITNNVAETYGVIISPSEVHTVETGLHNNVTMFYAEFEDFRHTVEFMYNLTSNVGVTTIARKGNGSILNVAYIDDIRETPIPLTNYTNLELDFIFTEDSFDYYGQLMGYGLLFNGVWENTTLTSTLKYSIFNEGGIPIYTGDGNYTIYDDNDIFSIGAVNDSSWVQFNVLYDKLQHMHFEVEFDTDGDWEAVGALFENLTGGFYEYGINYWFQGEYLEGWKVRIYPSSFKVGHQNAGSDFDWVQWTVEHYFFNRSIDAYQLGETEFLYSNFNGYDEASSTPDYHNRTSSTWWVDMWFSNDNASQKVATRVNTEWYGMYEQGVAWWFGYGGFRPMQGDLPESIYYNDVYNNINQTDTVKDNVDIVEFWGRVEKITGGDREYIMHNYLMKNKVLAQGDMLGMDTPALVETKVMDMPQNGFLSPLLKVLSDIQRMVYQGIINVVMGLGVLVDTILVSIGLPPLMSVFFTFLGGIYDVFTAIYVAFFSVIDWMVESIEGMIASIFLVIPRYLLLVGLLLQTFVSYYENIVLLFTGGLGGMGNFWLDYNVFEIIELYVIAIFPFIEIAKIEASDDPLKTLQEDVGRFLEIVTGVFNLARQFMELAFNIIKGIIGVI